MKRLVILISLAVLLGAGVALFASWRDADAPNSSNSPTQLDGESAFIRQSADHSIVLTEGGYSPEIITIQQGETVAFENRTSIAHVPASDPHPTHSDLPEFDAVEPVAPGDVYTFTFTQVGEWGYHDHLNPSLTGTIVVE